MLEKRYPIVDNEKNFQTKNIIFSMKYDTLIHNIFCETETIIVVL